MLIILQAVEATTHNLNHRDTASLPPEMYHDMHSQSQVIQQTNVQSHVKYIVLNKSILLLFI
jgi:hypothetical protein